MMETTTLQMPRRLDAGRASDTPLPLRRFSDYEDTAARFGLEEAPERRESLVLGPGESLSLSTRPGVESAVVPHLLRLDDLDQLKTWIGTPDESFERGVFAIPSELPSRPWSGDTDFDADALTEQQRADIDLAARCYLFGFSPLVDTYRDAIVRLYAPFMVAAYMIRKLRIEPGAELTVSGAPALLLFDRIDLYRGGRVLFYDPFAMWVRHLHKHELS